MKITTNLILLTFIFGCLLTPAAHAGSGWSWGIGYHNPPNATLGLNFMHLWSNWAFELGLGYVNSTETNSTNSSNQSSSTSNVNLSVAGDINLKYLFSSGGFRPYLQGGTYAGVGARAGDSSGASASVGGGFVGAGFFIMGSSVDFYLSFITAGSGSVQLGLCF
jgi:hypothetical protein